MSEELQGNNIPAPAEAVEAPAPASAAAAPAPAAPSVPVADFAKQKFEDLIATGLAKKASELNALVEDAPAQDGTAPAESAVEATSRDQAVAPGDAQPQPSQPLTEAQQLAELRKELDQFKAEKQQQEAQAKAQAEQAKAQEIFRLDQEARRNLAQLDQQLREHFGYLKELESKAEEVKDDYGLESEEYARAYREWNIAYNSFQNSAELFKQREAFYLQTAKSRAETNAMVELNASLKAQGLTVADLKTANDKLDFTKPHEVAAATAAAALAKQQARIEALEKQLKEVETKARDKWDTSPAAYPNRPGASLGNGGQDVLAAIRNGDTNRLLAEGYREKTKQRR